MSLLVRTSGPRFSNNINSAIPNIANHFRISKSGNRHNSTFTSIFSSVPKQISLFDHKQLSNNETIKKVKEIPVPRNLDLLQVVKALHKRATWPDGMSSWDKTITTKWLTDRFVQDTYLETLGGKDFGGINFQKFPYSINVDGFDKLYGLGAAEDALKKASEEVLKNSLVDALKKNNVLKKATLEAISKNDLNVLENTIQEALKKDELEVTGKALKNIVEKALMKEARDVLVEVEEREVSESIPLGIIFQQ